jgi:hypothetical protein
MINLIDIDEYKIYAKISSTDQDDKLDLLSISISELVKIYCARSFVDYYSEDKTEYFNGGSDIYYTSEMPIVTITSVSTSVDYGQTYVALVNYTDYILDISNDRLLIPGAENIDSPNYFKVIYKAGYPSIPADLKLALFDLIDYYMKKESTPRKSSSDVSVQYITNSDFPPHIKRVLDLYRIIR